MDGADATSIPSIIVSNWFFYSVLIKYILYERDPVQTTAASPVSLYHPRHGPVSDKITTPASCDLLSDYKAACAYTVCSVCVCVLWKQKLVQLYKPADREPTEVTLEDRGISLIVRRTVTAHRAMCSVCVCVCRRQLWLVPTFIYGIAVHRRALRATT